MRNRSWGCARVLPSAQISPEGGQTLDVKIPGKMQGPAADMCSITTIQLRGFFVGVCRFVTCPFGMIRSFAFFGELARGCRRLDPRTLVLGQFLAHFA